MSNLSLILPFLKNMVQPPPSDGSAPAPDVVDASDIANNPSKLPNKAAMPSFLSAMAKGPIGPEPPPSADADVSPPPLNLGQGEVLPPGARVTATGDPNQDMPGIQALAQAPQADQGTPQSDKGSMFRQPGETKGHALLRILTSAARGGLDGLAANADTYAATGRNAGFGGGYQGASVLPMQRAMLSGQAQRVGLENQQLSQMLPFLRAQQMATIYKTKSEVDKNNAEAGKANAETGAIPTKQALEEAQTEASHYKDDPNLGLVDLRTGNPIAGDQSFAPLTADEAAILGKQPREHVPLKIKNSANEMVNRGVHMAQGGGRSLIVDSKGNTIKDLGAATPMAVINATNPMSGAATPPKPGQPNTPVPTGEDTLKGMTPQQASLIRGIASYDLDPKRYMTPRNAAAGAQLMAAVRAYNPKYDDTAFAEKGRLRKDIGTQSQAFNTATHHLDLLNQAIDALNNKNVHALNAIGNAYHLQMGDDAVTNFNTIKEAVVGELSKIFKGGAATDKEIANQQANLSANSSPKQLKGAVNNYIKLMQGRLDGLEETYEGQIGIKPNFQIVSPRAQQIFSKAGGSANQTAQPAQHPLSQKYPGFVPD